MPAKLIRNVCRGLLGLAMTAMLGGQAHAALTTLDPLVRAAPPSAHADKAMLMGVAMAGRRIVAVGERGIVITSDDHGASWQQAKVPVSVLLTAVRFESPEKGWAIGHSGVVLRTEDGGRTWVKRLDGAHAAELLLQSVRQEQASGAESARRMADAERLVKDGADKPFFDILIDGAGRALVIGAYGLAYRTEDGGQHWVPWQNRIANPKGAHLHALGASGRSVYIAGEQGLFLSSRDQGQTFAESKTPYTGSYFGITALTEQNLILFGLRGKCYWSSDGGVTWQASVTGVEASFNGATVLGDGSVVIVSQAGNVLRSVDQGRTFQPVPVSVPAPFVGVTQAADGGIVLVGVRGATRATLPSVPAATKP